jgi:hypothetical protein
VIRKKRGAPALRGHIRKTPAGGGPAGAEGCPLAGRRMPRGGSPGADGRRNSPANGEILIHEPCAAPKRAFCMAAMQLGDQLHRRRNNAAAKIVATRLGEPVTSWTADRQSPASRRPTHQSPDTSRSPSRRSRRDGAHDFPPRRSCDPGDRHACDMRAEDFAEWAAMRRGGWGGIRTHETVSRPPVFKTGAFNRSATHPSLLVARRPIPPPMPKQASLRTCCRTLR